MSYLTSLHQLGTYICINEVSLRARPNFDCLEMLLAIFTVSTNNRGWKIDLTGNFSEKERFDCNLLKFSNRAEEKGKKLR